MTAKASPAFQAQLTALLPKMRIWALSLTRNGPAADDLIQDVAMKALMASESFIAGTNFTTWLRRIMFNHFVSGVRQRHEFRSIDDVPEAAVRALQQEVTDIRELNSAFQRLPRDQQDALRSVALEERPYEEISQESGLAVGTLKSRVHRARLNLRAVMSGEARDAA